MRFSFACLVATVVAMLFTGCATESEVRTVCKPHNGVNAVSGNSVRKWVACKDGYFKVVR